MILVEGVREAELPADLNISLVERYTDSVALNDGLLQGLRFDVIAGKPSFRAGAYPDEQADIIVEISAGAARTLNSLHAADPRYKLALEAFLNTGEMRVTGDIAQLGQWLAAVHDRIVDRTQ
jgi:hypothetical protein